MPKTDCLDKQTNGEKYYGWPSLMGHHLWMLKCKHGCFTFGTPIYLSDGDDDTTPQDDDGGQDHILI